MNSKTPTLVVIGLLVAGALVHGAITQRWSVFDPDAARAVRMHSVEVAFPDCDVEEYENDVPLKERSVATSRRYLARDGSFSAALSIISGVPGAVATHTPDVCYTASGYRMIGGIKRESVKLTNGSEAVYFVADFEKKKESQADRLRIRWSWTTSGNWEAPDHARFHFMKSSELFKLYIVTPRNERETTTDQDSAIVQRFIRSTFEQYSKAFEQPASSNAPSPLHQDRISN